MRRRIWMWGCSLVFLGLISIVLPARPVAGQSSSNGVYGGYLGSDAWFASMRRAAGNQAMLRALGGPRDSGQVVPPDYVEFAGVITFPQGNPFPKKRLPDLLIVCQDQGADSVERLPFVDDQGAFYTVFKKGQSYDLYWSYYFGGREKFASIHIDARGPGQRRQIFEYQPPGATDTGNANESKTSFDAPREAESVSASRTPEAGRQPLTTSEIIDLLENGVPAGRVEKLVREFHVGFELDPTTETQLRLAGATDEVVEAIRQSPPPPSPSESAGQPTAPGVEGDAPAPVRRRAPEAPTASRPPPDYDRFDLSGFPRQPTNFEEQQVVEDIRSATTPALKAVAHERLARYYEKRGDRRRADGEYAKADYWRNAQH